MIEHGEKLRKKTNSCAECEIDRTSTYLGRIDPLYGGEDQEAAGGHSAEEAVVDVHFEALPGHVQLVRVVRALAGRLVLRVGLVVFCGNGVDVSADKRLRGGIEGD